MGVSKKEKFLRDQLFKILEKLGISQNQFAKGIKWDQSTISRIGKNDSIVSEKLIDAICAGYNINKNWFTTGSGDMFNQALSIVSADDLKNDEQDLIGTYRELYPPAQEHLLKQAHDLRDTQEALLHPKGIPKAEGHS
ncbi:hypothetical protein FACS1894110_25370 [Spirochaetia bacterium]|nr:hypothetical protein FACS1894110_25370 [Spirochaetia bacterium]